MVVKIGLFKIFDGVGSKTLSALYEIESYMTQNHLRFDFNLVKGLVTHPVRLLFALLSFSPDACEQLI